MCKWIGFTKVLFLILGVFFIVSNVFLSTMICKGLEEDILPQLTIIVPAEVNETDGFVVTTTSNGTPISNVSVTFNEEIETTRTSGQVTFTAPEISPFDNPTFSITASKEGYNSTILFIIIRNVPSLVVSAPYDIIRGRSFSVTVCDGDTLYYPVENVSIYIDGDCYQTNREGQAVITIPLDQRDGTYLITAVKEGYRSVSFSVNVYPPHENINLVFIFYFLIFPVVVCISLVIIIYLIFKARTNGKNHNKNKRSNQQ